MADTARRRLQLALMDGEATEAQRWLRIFKTLSSMAPATGDVHTLHPDFSPRTSDRTDAPARPPSTTDARSEPNEVHQLHPVLSSDDANPSGAPFNRAERRRLRRAQRRTPPSASHESHASQGP